MPLPLVVVFFVVRIFALPAHDSSRPHNLLFLEVGEHSAWTPRISEQGHSFFAAHPPDEESASVDHALVPSPHALPAASPHGAGGAEEAHHNRGHSDVHEEGDVHGHAEHGGHEHAEHHGHGHGHGHAEETVSGRVLSFTLIGAVAFAMSLFYLVNHKDEDIRLITWKILDMTVSIFCAVMMYGCVEAVIHEVFRHPSDLVKVVLALILFLAFYGLVQFLLFQFKEDKMKLRAAGTVLAHTTGFAALHCFAQLQAIYPFNSNMFTVFFVVVIAAGTIIALEVVADKARTRVALANDGLIDDGERHWMEQVEETENDVFGFCVGFLLMQVCRFTISGAIRIYDPHEVPAGRTQTQANLMMGCGIFFALLTLISTIVSKKFLHSDFGKTLRKDGIRSRYIKLSATVSGMAMAWCLLFWADWQLYAFGFDGARIMACMLEALCLTLLSFLLIFALDFGADYGVLPPKALRSVISALGLLVGFSWERSFHIALADVGQLGVRFGLPPSVCLHGSALLLVLVVLPAWYYYILPNSEEDHGMGEAASARFPEPTPYRRATLLTPRTDGGSTPSAPSAPSPPIPFKTTGPEQRASVEPPAGQTRGQGIVAGVASAGVAAAKVAAEGVGTCLFVFAFCGIGMLGHQDWSFIVTASVLVLLMYATGFISHGHLNPAVSLAFAVSNRLQWAEAGAYVIAQLLGGVAGAVACAACCRVLSRDETFAQMGESWLRMAPSSGYTWWQAAAVEVFYTALLCFVALNCAGRSMTKKQPSWGFAIGTAVLAAGHGASVVSGGFLNPALTIGVGIVGGQHAVSWAFVYCGHQMLGAGLAAVAFAMVRPGEFGLQVVHLFGVPLPAVAAEAWGTFFLVLTVCINLFAGTFLLALSGAAAFVALAFSVFDVSGSHFNPVVTLAAVSVGQMRGLHLCRPMRGFFYVLVQLFAAILAAAVYHLVSVERGRQVGPSLVPWGFWPAAFDIVFTCAACVLAVVQMVKEHVSGYTAFSVGKCTLIALCLGVTANPAASTAITAVNILRGGSFRHGILFVIAECVGCCIAIVLLVLTLPFWHASSTQSLDMNKPREAQVWGEVPKTLVVNAPREVPASRQSSQISGGSAPRHVPVVQATDVAVLSQPSPTFLADAPRDLRVLPATDVAVVSQRPQTVVARGSAPVSLHGSARSFPIAPFSPAFSTRSVPATPPLRLSR